MSACFRRCWAAARPNGPSPLAMTMPAAAAATPKSSLRLVMRCRSNRRLRECPQSYHGNRFIGRNRGAVVVDPGKPERPALIHPGREMQIGIGRYRRFEIASEYRAALEFTGKFVDDLARND